MEIQAHAASIHTPQQEPSKRKQKMIIQQTKNPPPPQKKLWHFTDDVLVTWINYKLQLATPNTKTESVLLD